MTQVEGYEIVSDVCKQISINCGIALLVIFALIFIFCVIGWLSNWLNNRKLKGDKMDLREKIVYVAIAILVISSILMGSCLYEVRNILEEGSHLKNARVSYSVHPTTPWAEIPIFLREQIAMGHPGTKLDRTDLKHIILFYQELFNTYDNRAVSIANKVVIIKIKDEAAKEGAE